LDVQDMQYLKLIEES